MMRKRISCQCFLLVTLVSVMVSCKPRNGNNQQQLLELSVQEIQPVNRVINEHFSAIIRGKQDIDIRPQISGFITEVRVDEGEVVHKGQVLFVIDQVQYQEAVNAAKANVEVAKSNVKTAALTERNRKDLAAKNVISQYDYQLAQNELKRSEAILTQVEAQLVSAQKNLSYTEVISPSNGIVGQIPFRIGALVSPSMSQSMTTVSDYSEMYAYFSMTEKSLLDLTQNLAEGEDICEKLPQVSLQLANGKTYNERGIIKTISGVIDEATGAVSVRALFHNKNKILRSGGTGVIVMPHYLDSCIVIPQSATYEIQNQKFVYVLGDSAIIHATQIETYSIDNGQEYIITKGLKPGDTIVKEGVANVRDGITIKPKVI
ncbi:efflux RND transporter periplasmic adaptor subunit [Geofilum sp. OHC36d9]|uniref:efflux RND transporter periplasmic adaptor subunit n=1 Tax=Geofilum sp. OHC36d9 TaxID=3458413 RepID=UPI004033B722